MKQVVSIIIPHYNSAKYLVRLIESIPYREDIQIIVVDDSSSERDIEKVIEKYDYIEFYSNTESEHSAGTCRNIGLEHAIGQWVLFADADDYFNEGFWEKIAAFFNCDADIVFFRPTSVYNESGESAKRHVFYEKIIRNYLKESSKKNELILRYEYVSPCSKLIKKELIDKNEIKFEKVRYANDVMFSTKIALKAKKIAASEEVIYVITRMEGTLTSAMTEENFLQRMDVFIRKHDLLKSELTYNDFLKLNIHGTAQIVNVFKYKLGLKVLLTCIKRLRRNHIPVLNPEYLKMRFWKKMIKERI